jgi:lysophospholipid acyltransferase (LPLAT)-like uncharacterized protein
VPHQEHEVQTKYTWWQRFKLTAASSLASVVISLLAPTLRFRVSSEDDAGLNEPVHPGIFAFWHRCVLPATWRFRDQQLAVLTSRSFDGEIIARVIRRFGFVPVRGSSSRGASEGLKELRRVLLAGGSVAFTVDGPRGPRYVAKRGPVLLASMTGVRVVPFYVAVRRPWVLRSWDAFMVPKPFSHALVRVGRRIEVPIDADAATLERCHAELQAALERVRLWAEEHV